MTSLGPRPPTFVVSSEKLTHYLLEADHPEGGSKARFFRRRGFAPERHQELAAALLTHVASAAHVATIDGVHGLKFVFEGSIAAPDGMSSRIRSVWQIDAGAGPPARFITAVPL